MVLLINSLLRLYLGKLKSKWRGPFKVICMTDHGTVELWNEGKQSKFIVNGQRVKHHCCQNFNGEVEYLELSNE